MGVLFWQQSASSGLQQPRLIAALPCNGINVLSVIIGRDPEYSFFFHTNTILGKNH